MCREGVSSTTVVGLQFRLDNDIIIPIPRYVYVSNQLVREDKKQ